MQAHKAIELVLQDHHHIHAAQQLAQHDPLVHALPSVERVARINHLLPVQEGGALVRVAVTGARRSPLLPEVPTVAETLPVYEATAYYYIAVPAGTPRPLVMAINAAFNRALSDPEIIARMTATGLEPLGADSPEQAADTILAERRRWRGVIQAAGIRLED
jgi:tripartite-type tricarboxylate transporter receptor subunit TctC